MARDAISDTGPILHLHVHEIGHLAALGIFDHLSIPELVIQELRAHGLALAQLEAADLTFSVVTVTTEHWQGVLRESEAVAIQPADLQVYALAEANAFRQPVLTDDLTLRRRLEAGGAVVVGTIGILMRAYTLGRIRRDALEAAVDALFDQSTLDLSRPFRAYVRQLLASLP